MVIFCTPEKAGPVCHICNRSSTGGETSAISILLLCWEAPQCGEAHGREPLLKTLLLQGRVMAPPCPATQQRCFSRNWAGSTKMAPSSTKGSCHLVPVAQSQPGVQCGSHLVRAAWSCMGVGCAGGAGAV